MCIVCWLYHEFPSLKWIKGSLTFQLPFSCLQKLSVQVTKFIAFITLLQVYKTEASLLTPAKSTYYQSFFSFFIFSVIFFHFFFTYLRFLFRSLGLFFNAVVLCGTMPSPSNYQIASNECRNGRYASSFVHRTTKRPYLLPGTYHFTQEERSCVANYSQR